MAVVEGQGEEPIECTPAVCDEFANCGVGIFYPDGHGQVWGMVTPRNLIASWRATEILQHLDRIEHGTLSYAYTAALRKPHSSDQEKIDAIVEKIGREEYERIMALPVPEVIVRAILDNQEKGDDNFPPALWPIAQEVAAGTLEWRQEFFEAGISHPDWDEMRDADNEALIERFESLFQSWSKRRALPRECMGMWEVESALLHVIQHGVEKQHGDKIAFAVATVAAELTSADFTRVLMPSVGPRSKEELYRDMEQRKREAASKTNDWLSELGSPKRRLFGDKPRQVDHTKLLIELVDECFPPKDKELAEEVSSDYERASVSA